MKYTFPELVVSARERKSLGHDQIDTCMDAHSGYTAEIESGKRIPEDRQNLIKLCECLDVDYNEAIETMFQTQIAKSLSDIGFQEAEKSSRIMIALVPTGLCLYARWDSHIMTYSVSEPDSIRGKTKSC